MKQNFILKKKNQESYVTKGSLGVFLSQERNKATEFNYVDARTFIKNNHQYGCLEMVPCTNSEQENKPIKLDSIQKQIEFKQPKLDLGKLIDTFSSLKDDLKEEKSIYFARLKKLERASSDLSHYKELKRENMTPEKRDKIESLYADILIKRREVKDNIRLINIIEFSLNEKYDINVELSKMNNRQYSPREFDCLFDNDEIPSFGDWWRE